MKNRDVVMRPSQEMNRNWEKVIRFPEEGKALKIKSKYRKYSKSGLNCNASKASIGKHS